MQTSPLATHSLDPRTNPSGPCLTPVRVGRLLPLPGVRVRPHPDRGQVQQALREMRSPLAAMHTLLSVIDEQNLPTSQQAALRAAINHNEFLEGLVADFADLGHLEADSVVVRGAVQEPRAWIEARLEEHRGLAAGLHCTPRLVYRSFLPSQVRFASELAARAFGAVLRVALPRAVPGRVDVRVAYAYDRQSGRPARLTFEIATLGGGYAAVEQGYVFAPFAVRDAAGRPLLGLAIAQRLLQLLGGELRVDSPGPSVCTYRLEFVAEATPSARWLDPAAATPADLGPVRPGPVWIVGGSTDARLLWAPALQRAGFDPRAAADDAALLAVSADRQEGHSAVVLDATCGEDAATALAMALRQRGFAGAILRVLPAGATSAPVHPFDQLLVAPCSGRDLLAALLHATAPRGEQPA